MKKGDNCYIVENNFKVVPVVIINILYNIYTIKFIDRNTVIRVPKHRLYESEEDALHSIPKGNIKNNSKRGYYMPDMH